MSSSSKSTPALPRGLPLASVADRGLSAPRTTVFVRVLKTYNPAEKDAIYATPSELILNEPGKSPMVTGPVVRVSVSGSITETVPLPAPKSPELTTMRSPSKSTPMNCELVAPASMVLVTCKVLGSMTEMVPFPNFSKVVKSTLLLITNTLPLATAMSLGAMPTAMVSVQVIDCKSIRETLFRFKLPTKAMVLLKKAEPVAPDPSGKSIIPSTVRFSVSSTTTLFALPLGTMARWPLKEKPTAVEFGPKSMTSFLTVRLSNSMTEIVFEVEFTTKALWTVIASGPIGLSPSQLT